MKGGWYEREHEIELRQHTKGDEKAQEYQLLLGCSVPNSTLFSFNHWPKRDHQSNFKIDCMRDCRRRQKIRRVVWLDKLTEKMSYAILTLIAASSHLKNNKYKHEVSVCHPFTAKRVLLNVFVNFRIKINMLWVYIFPWGFTWIS